MRRSYVPLKRALTITPDNEETIETNGLTIGNHPTRIIFK